MDGKLWTQITLFAFGCILIASNAGVTTSAAIQDVPNSLQLPENWTNMEIESKWEISEAQFEALVAAFPAGGNAFGYEARVRWGGVSRKFIDTYYDTASLSLAQNSHSLRHRTRYRTQPLATGNTAEDLNAASWVRDWERVQYKSTPCRIEATWFRFEGGSCRTSSSDNSGMCLPTRQLSAGEVIYGDIPGHQAIDALASDHPNFLLSSLQPTLNVFDYRYRVVLRKDGADLFELSLDRLYTTDLLAGGTRESFEAELEILAEQKTIEDVRTLLGLSSELQREFDLRPSWRSKGGVPVGLCSSS